jgi:hypothetical protein
MFIVKDADAFPVKLGEKIIVKEIKEIRKETVCQRESCSNVSHQLNSNSSEFTLEGWITIPIKRASSPSTTVRNGDIVRLLHPERNGCFKMSVTREFRFNKFVNSNTFVATEIGYKKDDTEIRFNKNPYCNWTGDEYDYPIWELRKPKVGDIIEFLQPWTIFLWVRCAIPEFSEVKTAKILDISPNFLLIEHLESLSKYTIYSDNYLSYEGVKQDFPFWQLKG